MAREPTYPVVVDLMSGTWFDADNVFTLRLTELQANRFKNMTNAERIVYAREHGSVLRSNT